MPSSPSPPPPLPRPRTPTPPPPPVQDVILYRGIEYVLSNPIWDPPGHRYVPKDEKDPTQQKPQYNYGQLGRRLQFTHDAKPVLPRTDVEFERRHKELYRLAMRWVEKYFTYEKGDGNATRMKSAEMKEWGERNGLLVRWIDSVACAYNENWLDIFSHARHLLAMGVLGKVLEDRVFKDVFFGGSRNEKDLLNLIDEESERKELDKIHERDGVIWTDALSRQKTRATIINGGLPTRRRLPVRFAQDINSLFKALVDLLRPLLLTKEGEVPDEEYYLTLDHIIASAAKLSLDMRREPDTVYYVAITPPRYEGIDRMRMSPVIYDAKECESDFREFESYSNIISVWPGVFAYRRQSLTKVSVRTIRHALLLTKHNDRAKGAALFEMDPDGIITRSQLWEYLSFLGVSNSGDGRNWD